MLSGGVHPVKAAPALLLAVAPMMMAASSSNKADRMLALQFAGNVGIGNDVSVLYADGTDSAEWRDELVMLNGCSVAQLEMLKPGDWGVQWSCPKDKTPLGRTAAVVRIADGKIVKVLMSTVQEKTEVRRF